MICVVTFLLVTLVAVVTLAPHRVFGPPIEAHSIPTEDRILCAGQYEVVYFDYKINRPGVVKAAEIIYEAETGYPVDSSNLVFGPFPFDRAMEVSNFPMGWTVPDLPPGKYRSVMAIYHDNIESTPEFVEFAFEIVECGSDETPNEQE